MRLLILSDIHDHLQHFQRLLDRLSSEAQNASGEAPLGTQKPATDSASASASQAANEAASGTAIDAVIGCGDYCAPFVIADLGEAFSVPVHLVWGNNDGDRAMQQRIAARYDHVQLEGEWMDRAFGECRVFVSHYPAIARAAAQSSTYGLALYGHDHQAHAERIGDTLLLNPGSIMGYQPAAKKWVLPTACLYDVERGRAETLYLE